jgi:translation initiation factor IF-2
MDAKRGRSATLIIKKGAIHKGSFIQSGISLAPTRIMENFIGKNILEAVSGQAVKVTGFDEVPTAGNTFTSFDNKKDAEKSQEEAKLVAHDFKNADESMAEFQFIDEGIMVLPLILKTDVLGTLEAVESEIKKIEIPNVMIKIIGRGVGGVMEKDIQIAKSDKNSVIVAFHTSVDKKAREIAEINKVAIYEFDIIYKLSEWLQEFAKTVKPKVEIEEVLGSLKVIRVFNRSKDSQVVGGKVYTGVMKNKHTIVIERHGVKIGKGKVIELQHAKQSVNEVAEGLECGLMVDSKYDIAEGDFLQVVIKRTV